MGTAASDPIPPNRKKTPSSSEVGEGGGGLGGREGDSSKVGVAGEGGGGRGGGGRRDGRGNLSYTTLRHVNCNRLVDCNGCWQVGIIAVTSIFIRASSPTHYFKNFVGDLYGIEIYEPRIQIRFPIYCWKAMGVRNMDRLNLGVPVEVYDEVSVIT